MARVCDGSELPHADKSKVLFVARGGTAAYMNCGMCPDRARPKKIDYRSRTDCATPTKAGGSATPESPTWYPVSPVGAPSAWGKFDDLSDPQSQILSVTLVCPASNPARQAQLPSDMHGAMSTGPKGNRVYAAYGTTKSGVIEILDRDKLIHGPKEPTDANLTSPDVGMLNLPPDVGAHTTYPMLGMDLPDLAKKTASKASETSSSSPEKRRTTNAMMQNRWSTFSTSPQNRAFWAFRRGPCRRRAAVSAAVEDASARTQRMRT